MTTAVLNQAHPNRGRQFDLHSRYINPQMRRMLHLLGMDTDYVRAQGTSIFDAAGNEYLDFLTHCGVFAIGHNHPHVVKSLREMLAADLPNILMFDCSLLSGLLAERLLKKTPHLGKVFFGNSGAEAVEAALKMARGSTGRPRIVSFEGAYHGLTYGALSVVGHEMWQEGFGPLLPGCTKVPFNDVAAVERELAKGGVACVLGETILGDAGVILPLEGYWREVAELCRRHGTLLVLDEVQVGLGRTGRFFAYERYGVEPDMVILAKALSGGQAPVSAVLMRDAVFNKVFSRIDRCFIHCGTYCENNLAMTAALATLDVIEDEGLVARSEEMGRYFFDRLTALMPRYELIKEVRGEGLFVAVEFGRPRSMKLRLGWDMVNKANEGLFGQMITVPLYRDHRMLCQVAGHAQTTLKLMPPLNASKAELDRFVAALDAVLAEAHRFPGSLWSFGLDLIKKAFV